MMGIYFPKQYGGAGGDVLSYAMCVEELAKVCGTTAVIVSAHTSLCAAPIFENGTEEQKMKYLPDLCSGKKIGAFGLTEPGAGTDAQGQQTTAVLDESGENYILNGSFLTCDYTLDNFMDLYMPYVGARGAKGSAYIEENIDKEMARMLEAHAQNGPKLDDDLKARVREVLVKETGISAQQLDAIEAL